MIIKGSPDQWYFYHYDGLGSVVALSNTSGAIVASYSYDAFGTATVTGTEYGNPYRFTGRRWDDETSLYYYRARMYKPDIGRFLQPDPIGYDDGMNMYAYVGNNPVRFVDPMGLKLEFAPKTSWSNKRAYKKAIKKLSKTALFRNTYEYLSREDTPLVTIAIGPDDSQFSRDYGTLMVYWNKKQRVKTHRGLMSAAVALAHEMEHARIYLIGGINEPRNEHGYKPIEENYIVEWFEGPIARELDEPYRKDYLEPNRTKNGKGCNK